MRKHASLEGSPIPDQVQRYAQVLRGPRVRAGTSDDRRGLRTRISDSHFKQSWVIARVVWLAPGAPRPLCPRHMPRASRADETRHSFRRPHALLETCARLSARRSGVVARRTGRACENVDQPRPSAGSWRQVLVPASGARRRPSAWHAFAEPTGTASAPVNRDASRRRPRPDRTMGGSADR